ncbi:MAG: ROK family protein [Anaerolineae bacterium]
MGSKPLIGIDLGGTKTAVAAITPDGQILARTQLPTGGHGSPEAFMAALVARVREVLAGAEPAAIGIGASGPLDLARGTIHNPYTLPLPDGADIVTPFHETFNVPVALENDADAAALGEHWRGAAQGYEFAVCLTFGTGVGGGIVVQGRVFRGAGGVHPEIGHMPVDPSGPQCYCGVRGCLEAVASGTAIGQAGQEAAQGRSGAALLSLAGGRAEAVRAEHVFAAARAGDATSGQIIARAVRATADAVFGLVHTLAPDAMILGGGVMRHYDLFEPAVRDALKRCILVPGSGVHLAPAQLGNDAGVLGAARAAALSLQQQG